MKVTMYHDKDEWWYFGGEIPPISCLICADQNINIEHEVDAKKVLEIIKGNYHPGLDNNIIVAEDGTVIKDYFELVKWIETNGLRLC